MKMLQVLMFWGLSLSMTSGHSATVFTANNVDVDFIVPADFDYEIAIFSNAADLASGIGSLAVTLDNFIPGFFGGQDLISGESSIASGAKFVVGLTGDNGLTWVADSGFSGDSTGVLTFGVNGSDVDVLLVDVRAVPVPAAILLFGSGLVGIVGVARRKLIVG